MSWSANTNWQDDAVVVVNGQEIPVNRSENFVDTIKRLARQHGIHNFNVVADGVTISPEEAPATFENVNKVEIIRYDKAGA